MAEIIANEGGGKKGHGKQRAKKHSTHIDMTPMVDLMSLLITFFMLTTAFSKPKVMEIVLPEKIKDSTMIDSTKLPKERTLNIVLSGEDGIYWYIGKPEAEDEVHEWTKTDFSKDGIRKVILEKNIALYERVDSATQRVIKGEDKISTDSLQVILKQLRTADKLGPIILIKADSTTKYRSIVDIIDEMAICNVARYSIIDINEYEVRKVQTLQDK